MLDKKVKRPTLLFYNIYGILVLAANGFMVVIYLN